MGISGLFSNILSMLALAELGVGSAMTFSLYIPLAQNDIEKIKSLMNFYQKAYRIIGTLVLLLGTILLPVYPYFISVQPDIPHLNLIYILYKEDVRYVSDLNLPWNCLNNSSILVSGATGLIGSFLIDVIMEKNIHGLNCHVYALGRKVKRAEQRFYYCFFNNPFFTFIECDINKQTGEIENLCDVDYVFHLASNTHPVQYSTDPIGTIMTNVFGLYNMLLFSVRHNTKRFIFSSSNEIYGENRGDIEKFHEGYCGYIDSNTLRAGYPESKRCGEAL